MYTVKPLQSGHRWDHRWDHALLCVRNMEVSMFQGFRYSLVSRLPHSGTRTLKLYRQGEPGTFSFFFLFLIVGEREYREDQTPSNPRRTNNDMHDDRKKDDSVGFAAVLACYQRRYTTDTSSSLLSLKEYLLYSLQCYPRHVRTTLRNNGTDF